MEETLCHLERKLAYRLDDDILERTDAPGAEGAILLSAIRRVRLAKLGKMSICELTFADGKSHCLTHDEDATRAAYQRLVRTLHAKLVERGDIEFVRGSWLIVATLAGIGLVVVLFGLTIHQRWLPIPAMLHGKALAVMILGGAWVVVGPLVVWRSRPRHYDPRELPRDLLD